MFVLTKVSEFYIDLPKIASTDKDSVDFGKRGIVVGVDFRVFVNDRLNEPYCFLIPLMIGVVYKKGLIRKMKLDPYILALYSVSYFEDSPEIDSHGISYATVDPERNRNFASVTQFNTLVIIGRSTAVTCSNNDIRNKQASTAGLLLK